MARLTTVKTVDAKMVKGDVIYTRYDTPYCQRFEPGTNLYEEMQKLARYEDIGEPQELLTVDAVEELLDDLTLIGVELYPDVRQQIVDSLRFYKAEAE